MLKILILFISFIALNIIYGQESKIVKPQEVNSNSVKTSASTKNITTIENSVTKTYLVKNEEYYSKFIEALKGKKSHMLDNPELNAKAESLDWYTKIDAEIHKAEKELLKLKGNDK